MGAKKKGGKKAKGKKGKKEEVAQEETEYDNMDLELLQEVVPMLKQQLEKSMLDRNYVQLERKRVYREVSQFVANRVDHVQQVYNHILDFSMNSLGVRKHIESRDTIQTFYDITKREVEALELKMSGKDREMELMEENHRVEIRVYMQKVKHLEYEHQNNIKSIANEGEELLEGEIDLHGQRASELKRTRNDIKSETEQSYLLNAEEIAQVKQAQEKTLTKMREGFDTNLAELRARCDQRIAALEDDLELRRKADIHEIEERKNLHINDLMRNHDKAFGQMKAYYNDITSDNLKLIRSLKDELAEMKKKSIANQKLMLDISHENKRLGEPLTVALSNVAELQAQLKGQDKDRLSLAHAKARLRVVEEQLSELRESHGDLEADFEKVVEERNQLYDTFEGAVRTVQQKSEFRNLALEQRMTAVEDSIEKAGEQLNQITSAAKLDPPDVHQATAGLEEVLAAKNAALRDLEYAYMRTAKGFNDSLRTYSIKLQSCGIPREEIDSMGFAPVPTAGASLGPAGLVAR